MAFFLKKKTKIAEASGPTKPGPIPARTLPLQPSTQTSKLEEGLGKYSSPNHTLITRTFISKHSL